MILRQQLEKQTLIALILRTQSIHSESSQGMRVCIQKKLSVLYHMWPVKQKKSAGAYTEFGKGGPKFFWPSFANCE